LCFQELEELECGVLSWFDMHFLLEKASEQGMIELVNCILDNSVYPTLMPTIALQMAARSGRLEVVERLLIAKADVNGYRRYPEAGQRLVAAKADVNAASELVDGWTALQAAAGGGHLEVVERLLAARADV
jgi:ankyrin repeat protein